MKVFSTRQAAKKLGIHFTTLAHYLVAGKVPAPRSVEVGGGHSHAWTEEEIESIRKLLPKIANGRKTRYKKQLALGNQQSARAKPKKKKSKPKT
jgi:predicted DNA-binding transcriptional regulator AlpA